MPHESPDWVQGNPALPSLYLCVFYLKPCFLLATRINDLEQYSDALFGYCPWYRGFPDGSVGKESACNAGDIGDTGSIPGSGRSPGEGNGNSIQYSCLGNPMDRGAWRATVHGVTKSQTQLNNWACTHTPSVRSFRCLGLVETLLCSLV